MKRGLTITIAAGLLLFCAAIITVYVSIGSIIIDAIETEGSEIAQTSVTLQEADFSTSTGLTTLLQLKVANPEGFQSKNALSFDKIEMWVDPESLSKDVLHIKSMVLVAPEIVYEFTDSADNLRTLKKYVEISVQRMKAKTEPAKKIIIDNFYIRNGVVVVQAAELEGQRKTAHMTDIHVENIGRNENGLRPAELVHQLLLTLLRETTLTAMNTDLSLSDQTRNLLNGAVDESQKALQSLKNLLR